MLKLRHQCLVLIRVKVLHQRIASVSVVFVPCASFQKGPIFLLPLDVLYPFNLFLSFSVFRILRDYVCIVIKLIIEDVLDATDICGGTQFTIFRLSELGIFTIRPTRRFEVKFLLLSFKVHFLEEFQIFVQNIGCVFIQLLLEAAFIALNVLHRLLDAFAQRRFR